MAPLVRLVWQRPWTAGLLGLAFLCVLGYWLVYGSGERARETPFDGSSAELGQTVIVPTLDSPLPGGKSAIWCGSFQLAWNRLCTDVAGQPVGVRNAEAVSQRLNQARFAESDLAAEEVYAAAGRNKHGIQQKIVADMEKKFPDAPVPGMDPDPLGITAFAYLQGEVKYGRPYQRAPDPLPFTDGLGRVTRTAHISGVGSDVMLFAPLESRNERGRRRQGTSPGKDSPDRRGRPAPGERVTCK